MRFGTRYSTALVLQLFLAAGCLWDAEVKAGGAELAIPEGASFAENTGPIQGSPLSPTIACTPPPTGMVAWWPADGSFNDIVQNHHGERQGGVAFAVRPDAGTPSVTNQAFSFANAGDMVMVSDDPSLNLESLIGSTFEGWFLSQGGDGVVIGKHTCGIPRGWFFTTDQGCFIGDHHIGGVGLAGLHVDDGTLHHFACVKDGATYREYIDGNLISQDTGPGMGTPVAEPVQIGSINTGTCSSSSAQLVGLADELSLYKRALSTTEIQAIFDAGSNGKCKTPSAEFTVSITTFIPGNHMGVSPLECVFRNGSMRQRRSLFVRTDDRWFDPKANTYRSRQLATLIPDAHVNQDGLKQPVNVIPLIQPTKLYASDALPDIDNSDDDVQLNDCSLLHAVVLPVASDAEITATRIAPKRVRVHMRGDVGTGTSVINIQPGLVADISWDVILDIDTAGQSPVVMLRGRHDGFPAYEIYVNDQEIYTYSPGNPPYGLRDLLKLLPPMEVAIPQTVKIIQ